MNEQTCSSAARRRNGVALIFVTLSLAAPSRALASPADTDEPLLLPRTEANPRLDLDEPALGMRPLSPLRAPVWFSVGLTMRHTSDGDRSFGAMFLLGLPLERLRARDVRSGAIADVAEPPALKPAPRAKVEPPPAPKPAPGQPPQLRIPIIVSSDAAKKAVDAALRRAKLADPDARVDAMITRARSSAALPELRLRALRSVDQGQALAPTEYDATRTTATSGSSVWMEARATWRLDRVIFAEEELSLERMRHDRMEARNKVTAHVLKLLFEWQRALALAENEAATPEENLAARLKAIESEVELDLITDGWVTRFRANKDAK